MCAQHNSSESENPPDSFSLSPIHNQNFRVNPKVVTSMFSLHTAVRIWHMMYIIIIYLLSARLSINKLIALKKETFWPFNIIKCINAKFQIKSMVVCDSLSQCGHTQIRSSTFFPFKFISGFVCSFLIWTCD